MNKYESVIIMGKNTKNNEGKSIITKIENLINENGKLTKTEEIGLRKLAYEIKGMKEGYYVVFYFESNFGFIQELERYYRTTDEILKFIVVRMDE